MALTTFPARAMALAAGLFHASTLFAQAPQARVTASIAGGIAAPLHADLGFTAPEWQVTVRTRVSRHVAMEIFVDQWTRAENTVFADVPLQGMSGLVGRAKEIRTRTAFTTRAVGWNTIVQGGPGRLTILGGGGPGYITFNRQYTLATAGCTPGSAPVCEGSESRHTIGSFAAQLVGGMKVALTSRIAVFGQFQLAVPMRDPGSSHASTTGGVRVGIW